MAQVEPEYEKCSEFNDIAQKIVDAHTEQFQGIDVSKINAVLITNKDRSEKQAQLWKLIAVSQPVRMDCPYAFYAVLYLSDWDGLLMKHKLLLVAQVLHAIPIGEDGMMDEGGVTAFDMKDFSVMLRTFGTDYLIKENVPNILEEDFKWHNFAGD
jgi:acyl-CoA thioesterase